MTKNETYGKVSGFIDKGTDVSGNVKFKDSFRIDGKFKGKIISGISLVIGESGEVEADISVDNISINGKFKGSIDAKSIVEIFAKGRVTGTIITPKLIIEENAFFQGSCQMERKALEDKKAEGIKPEEKKTDEKKIEEKEKPFNIK